MEYASGTYLGFVDSDDFVELDMFQKLYELHEKEDVDCVICARYNDTFHGGIPISQKLIFVDFGKYGDIILFNLKISRGFCYENHYRWVWPCRANTCRKT